MTTREQIVRELRKRRYPQTHQMLRDKIGKSTVQLLCRCLALEGRILERKYGDVHWYAVRPAQFQPYRVEYQEGSGTHQRWVTGRFCPTEVGGRVLAAHWANHDPAPYRLMHGVRIVCEWNTKEIEQWREAKRVVQTLRAHLRAPHSRTTASTPGPTSSA